MKEISILDCTLRDGGRVIDCAFEDAVITKIADDLQKAHIDIIEMGFIRDKREYNGDTTFFTQMEQIAPLITKNGQTQYVVFVDYGMFDETVITPRTKDGIDGIRFGFTKKNYNNEKETIRQQMMSLKEKGYDIYFQDVNTCGYSDIELIDLIQFANEINPVSFGIVDTYGSMDLEDLDRIYSIIHHNLNPEIAIDFHSHNNMQLSFALSQQMIKLCRDSRRLIIDATLNGMGKCAGNLNLELLVSYLNRKMHFNYDMDLLLDIIDEYLYEIKLDNEWGYTIPSFMAGIYKAHPNNVIYLTQKFRLKTKDIKHIIARIDEQTRQTYDYDNIQKIYVDYSSKKVNDRDILDRFKQEFNNRTILVLVPGKSLRDYEKEIQTYIKEENPIVITVNFSSTQFDATYEFYGNIRRYEKRDVDNNIPRIVSSNVTIAQEEDLMVNYFDIIESQGKYQDNSTIMLLNLLNRISAGNVVMAGFDGFTVEGNDFVDDTFYEHRFEDDYQQMNKDIELLLRGFEAHRSKTMKISFLTPSVYKKIFG